jgi:SAM-dependent methyltransferase
VPDVLFEDGYLASLYDRLCAGRDDERFYLDLVHSAPRVLDVGCGTGSLLHRARAAGHRGRLVGLDPATGMLHQASRYLDVEWVRGTLPEAGFDAEFDLVVMTGHAFQVLLDDAAVRAFFGSVRRALVPGGHFAFESRNPLRRAWEDWTPADARSIADDDGTPVRVWHEVEAVAGDLVTFAEIYASDAWPEPRVSRSTLRFLAAGPLDRLLRECGLAIHERYGNWDRRPFTPNSPEIITVAAAA